jgi:hypothetical protein
MTWTNLLGTILLFSWFGLTAFAQPGELPVSRDKIDALLKEGDFSEASRLLNLLAFQHWEHANLQQAKLYFKESLEINRQINNLNALATIQTQLGLIASEENDYQKALQYLEEALKIRELMKDKAGEIAAFINLAVLNKDHREFEKSIILLDQALVKAREINDLKYLKSIFGMLSESYEQLGKPEKSMEYFNYYSSIEKKLQQEKIQQLEAQSKQKLNEIEALNDQVLHEKKLKEQQLELTKDELKHLVQISQARQAEISLLNKDKEIKDLAIKAQEATISNEKLLKNSFFTGVIMMGMIAFIMFNGYRTNKQKKDRLSLQNQEIINQKAELESQRDAIRQKSDELEFVLEEIKSKNLKITSSINYAKRIQEAFLPRIDKIREQLPESFVLLKPRDLVSGDFYWFHHIAARQDEFSDIKEKILITAVDCTGHGVPGAFMSTIGTELLNQIIHLKGITSSDRILQELNRQIRISLNQEDNENKDGMDMALCVIHKAEKRIDFSGAKNPLIYIQNGELFHIKGDKHCIGGNQVVEPRIYTCHSISIDSPTMVYLFSDGFQDQFGGPEGKKYMIKNLKELLLRIHQLPMEEQKHLLEQELLTWQGDQHKQVDDILVVGFRI